MIADRGDAEYAYLAHQWTAQPTTITISGSTNRSAALAVGIYSLLANTACYFRQGGTDVNATTSDHYLPAGQLRFLSVDAAARGNVAAIQVSAAGTMFLHPLMTGTP